MTGRSMYYRIGNKVSQLNNSSIFIVEGNFDELHLRVFVI